MTVNIIGIIKNAGEEELSGTIRCSANKNFTDSNGEFHISNIPFSDDITEGEFSIFLPATIKNTLTTANLTDLGSIITFTSLVDGVGGNDITVTIEDGTNTGSKITINAGLTNEEPYDNLDMNEDQSGTYIVDYITSNSSLVSVTRVSAPEDDTLPTNQVVTSLTGGSTTNQVKFKGKLPIYYTFEFLNIYHQVYKILTKIELTYSASSINISDLF